MKVIMNGGDNLTEKGRYMVLKINAVVEKLLLLSFLQFERANAESINVPNKFCFAPNYFKP